MKKIHLCINIWFGIMILNTQMILGQYQPKIDNHVIPMNYAKFHYKLPSQAYFYDIQSDEIKYGRFEDVSHFVDGRALINCNGKWGMIDTNQYLTVDPFYSSIKYYRNGIALAKKEKWGALNLQEQTIIPFEYDHISRSLYANYIYVTKKSNTQILDTLGKPVISKTYSSIMPSLDGSYWAKEQNLWGKMSANHTVQIPFEYQDVHYQDSNLSIVQSHHEKCIINNSNQILGSFEEIEPQYQNRFYNSGELQLILVDSILEYLKPYEYKRNTFFVVKKNGFMGVLSANIDWWIPMDYIDLKHRTYGNLSIFVAQTTDNKWGVLTSLNRWLIKPRVIELKLHPTAPLVLTSEQNVLDLRGNKLCKISELNVVSPTIIIIEGQVMTLSGFDWVPIMKPYRVREAFEYQNKIGYEFEKKGKLGIWLDSIKVLAPIFTKIEKNKTYIACMVDSTLIIHDYNLNRLVSIDYVSDFKLMDKRYIKVKKQGEWRVFDMTERVYIESIFGQDYYRLPYFGAWVVYRDAEYHIYDRDFQFVASFDDSAFKMHPMSDIYRALNVGTRNRTLEHIPTTFEAHLYYVANYYYINRKAKTANYYHNCAPKRKGIIKVDKKEIRNDFKEKANAIKEKVKAEQKIQKLNINNDPDEETSKIIKIDLKINSNDSSINKQTQK